MQIRRFVAGAIVGLALAATPAPAGAQDDVEGAKDHATEEGRARNRRVELVRR